MNAFRPDQLGCVLLTILLLGGGTHGLAQAQYVHQAWTTDDGLPQNSASALVQTRDGYLWIGTYQGLVRFDGHRFTVFEAATTEGLRGDRITTFVEDRDGVLWIGTETGGLSSMAGEPAGP